MANTRISDLTASASNLASTDLAPVVQTAGVGPVKMTGLQLAGGLLGSTTFNGSTVTTSSPVLNLTQTWNDGAGGTVTFTGLKFNATDTASASGSLLLDLQVGGTSQFNVSKSGAIRFASPLISTDTVLDFHVSNSATRTMRLSSSGLNINQANASLSFSTSGFISWTDVFLTRAAAATLQLGAADAAAPVAQTLQVQSVVAGTSNTAGTNFTIQGSQGTGTGAGGSIIFQVASAGSAGSSQNAYSTALTIDSTGSTTFAQGNLFVQAGTGSNIIQLGSGFAVSVANNGAFRWSSTSLASGTADLILARDAANTLALRNGTNAQTFNIYGTYAASDNFERLAIQYGSSSDFVLRTEKGASGGSNRALTFETYGAATFTIAAQTLSTSSDGFYSWSTTTSSRGSANTRLYRDADGVIGVRGSGATSPAAMSFYTYDASPPAAPAASIVRIYADTSGGKIRLMALFPSGAAQQIAIEP